MMWWAMWCAAMLARSAAPAPANELPALDLAQLDPPSANDDGVSFGVPPMGGRYDDSVAPWLYLLAEMPREAQRLGAERRARRKRKMPSLSINNPMEVLRQRLMQEVVRKQMREANQRQAFANRLFLQNVGKRGFLTSSGSNHYDDE